MNAKEAIRKIEAGQTAHLYLIYGEETHTAREVEHALINKLLSPDELDTNLTIFEHEPSIPELLATVESVPFLGGVNVVIVRETSLFRGPRRKTGGEEEESAETDDGLFDGAATDDRDKLDKEKQRLVRLLQDLPPYCYLVFSLRAKPEPGYPVRYKDINKTMKLYKAADANGEVIEAAPLAQKDLRGWLEGELRAANKRMTQDALQYITDAVSFMPQISLGLMDNELQKICLYAGTKREIDRTMVETIFSRIPEVSAFKISDELGERRVGKALTLLREELSTGEPPARLLALIVSFIRRLYQVQCLVADGQTKDSIAKQWRKSPYYIEKLIKQGRNFNSARLKSAMLDLAALDAGIKSGTGDISGLEQIMIELCRQ